MEEIQLSGLFSIDSETELKDPKVKIKGIYFDFENNTHRVDVMFYEIHYKHHRSIEIEGVEAPDIKTIEKIFLAEISKI